MLDKLIEEGRLLRQRIEEHFRSGPDALPPEERISVPELEAWYKGVSHLLESQFGVESAEARLWREGLEQIRKESWEEVGRIHPYGGHWPIHNLVESLGLLAQIRILRTKPTTIRPGCRFNHGTSSEDRGPLPIGVHGKQI
jgi:hypothetical protein